MIPTIETQRLRLRAFRDSDLDGYAEYLSDPGVVCYLGHGQPLSRKETWCQMAMFLGHWSLRGYGMWAVENRQSLEFLGRVGFHHPEGWPGFEIGWVLGKQHWGKGFATEAGRVALAFAFTKLGRDSVISLIHPQNAASIAVAKRLGLSFHSEIEVGGIEVVVYRVTEAEFCAI
ncbi:GNAT family N-acetyltransferase [Acaryochloris sp. IP29b_bin.148]|uniref:GNAT family N-acetyltransferase n=1 Tax=Acaryochloris sp. IP29b_bin.148 TaxID=2969218 RepID=UPI00261C5488|nr:GNAT family N-acetyltransferase [Acaryochloris sp. IP29b_bin.148]